MKEKSAVELLRDLEDSNKELYRLYLLYGEENDYLKDQIINKVKLLILEGNPEEFNVEVFYGENFVLNEFQASLNSPPFFGKKMIVVKNAHNIARKDYSKAFSVNVPDFAYLIVTSNFKENKDIPGILEENSVLVKNYFVDRTLLESWIRRKFKDNEKDVTKDAIIELVNRLDNDFWLLDSEIRKLSLYVGDRKRIDASDIASVVDFYREVDVYALIEEILSGKEDKSIEMYNIIINSGQGFKENILLSQILKSMAQFLIIIDSLEKGVKDNQAISIVFQEIFKQNISPYIVGKLQKEAEKFSKNEILAKYSKLVDIDAKSKNGEIDLPAALKLFVQSS
jgi:DNA polymerase-3 subunit delta